MELENQYGDGTTNGRFMPAVTTSPGEGLPTDLLQIALTSADTVLYRYDLVKKTISFSDNIADVYPFGGPIPENERGWLSLIFPEDQQGWKDVVSHWQKQDKQLENHRYRIVSGNEVLWVRQSATLAEDGKALIGMIYFRCQPAQQTLRGMKVSSVKASASPTRRNSDYVYPEEFVDRLQDVMDHTLSEKRQGALLILSIANFSMIINAFGHHGSETVVKEIANEITKLLGPDDGLYRIHRDQLGIILSDSVPEEIEYHANQISDIIHNYGHTSSVGSLHAICAIGSVCFPAGVTDATDVIDKAYVALHQTNGTIHRSFTDGPDEKVVARQQMGLANYLRKAIRKNKLRLAFQPIYSSATGKVAHYEALLRLISEDGQISSAGALIPVAERMGLIDMVDHMVLEMVVKELEMSPKVHLAFNVSNLTTENPHWLQHFRNLLKDKPECASRLTVEITETAAHRDLRRTAYFVASVQELGCKVALDDFGSGYTSFRQLKALSVDIIKIDGSFIRDLADNADNRFFVKTLLEFTKAFNLESVAEYVENGETAKMLMDLGVDYMQGYYFGKPENFRSWLSSGEYQPS